MWISAIALASAFPSPLFAWADTTQGLTKTFNVAAEPWMPPWRCLADQAGVQIAFVGAQVKGHRSHAVHGTMPPVVAFHLAGRQWL